MPITPAASAVLPSRRVLRQRLPAGIGWLCRIGGALRLRRPKGEVPQGQRDRVIADTGLYPEDTRRHASTPHPFPAAGGASRAMDLAFSSQGFASGWVNRRP